MLGCRMGQPSGSRAGGPSCILVQPLRGVLRSLLRPASRRWWRGPWRLPHASSYSRSTRAVW
eukprot:11869076-Alexandrium_andersonii.AAC.1